jgi:epoxyqueuosine reductase
MTPSALDRRAATLTSAAIKAKALELGFDLCGVSAAVAHPKLARLAQWIADGRAGEMHYLADSLDERLDPRVFLPTACSVISLAVVYNSSAAPASTSTDDERRASIARYARGDDYHDVLRARMRALVQWMADTHGPGLEALTCVDDGPVQERVFGNRRASAGSGRTRA